MEWLGKANEMTFHNSGVEISGVVWQNYFKFTSDIQDKGTLIFLMPWDF